MPLRKSLFKILFVDDNEELLSALVTHFSPMNFDVLTAYEGLSALKILKSQSNSIDLVVTDIMLPYVSGIAIISFIKKNCPWIPVIAMTGCDSFPEALPKDACADFILQKPFPLISLKKYCLQCIEQRPLEAKILNDPTYSKNNKFNHNIEKIIYDLETKRIKRYEDVIIAKYSQRIKTHLDELYLSLLNLRKTINIAHQKITKEKSNSIKNILESLEVCSDIIISFLNCYIPPKHSPGKFNIKTLLNNHIDRLPKKRSYAIVVKHKRYRGKIFNDPYQCSQVFYTLFSHIHDYLQYSAGELIITTNRLPKELSQNPAGRFRIDFSFKVKNIIDDSNNKKRIIIVDDNIYFLEMIQEYLTHAGYIVDIVNSGYDFFDKLEKENDNNVYDLVLFDVLMEGMPGTEVIKVLRARRCYAHVPIIILSGHLAVESESFRNSVEEFNPVNFFYKNPEKLKHLLQLIESEIKKEKIYFDFNELCSTSLCESIYRDKINHLGFYPMEKAIKRVNGKMIVYSKGMEHNIVLEIPSFQKGYESSKTDGFNNLVSEKNGESILLETMNQAVRHNLKNKIDNIIQKINNITSSNLLSQQTILLQQVKIGLYNIIHQLKLIKEEGIK